ncbi:DUF6624 domain-containing protein [Xanthomonas axonopodis pv. vasculorum]|nr:DUF6624 domain-containing protein [Xanthomonas axonopodis]
MTIRNFSMALAVIASLIWMIGATSAAELGEGNMTPVPNKVVPLNAVAKKLVALGKQDQLDRKKAMTPGFDDRKLVEADRRRESAFLKLTSGRLLGLSDVGADAVTAQFLIIQHSQNRALQAKMAQQMQVLAEKGEFPKDDYATFIDRQRVYDGKPQLYGTQANQAFELYPIEDEAGVDARRADMNLPPIVQVRAQLQRVKKAVAAGKGLGEI